MYSFSRYFDRYCQTPFVYRIMMQALFFPRSLQFSLGGADACTKQEQDIGYMQEGRKQAWKPSSEQGGSYYSLKNRLNLDEQDSWKIFGFISDMFRAEMFDSVI